MCIFGRLAIHGEVQAGGAPSRRVQQTAMAGQVQLVANQLHVGSSPQRRQGRVGKNTKGPAEVSKLNVKAQGTPPPLIRHPRGLLRA